MSKEELFNEALTKGIDNEAIMNTLNDLLNKMSDNEVTKEVFKEAIDIIVLMKGNVVGNTVMAFNSDYLKSNGGKLIDALEKGISSLEISEGLNNVGESLRNDVANFIAFMKNQEVKQKEQEEQKQNKESFQKVLVNTNENK